MCSSRRHGWVGEHGGPKAEPDQHCCVGWCETSAQHGEARPAHCPTYRSRPERPDLFRVQTLIRCPGKPFGGSHGTTPHGAGGVVVGWRLAAGWHVEGGAHLHLGRTYRTGTTAVAQCRWALLLSVGFSRTFRAAVAAS